VAAGHGARSAGRCRLGAAALGFPGLVLDPQAPAVDVHLFTSPDPPEHWSRLDAFEGDGYQRAVA
jgi:gamma-glutamylcyclotransferase (GGCT)/AIG2-like uncharacterized protein YtfP